MSEKLEVNTVKPEISFSIDGVDLRILDIGSEFRLDSSIDSIRSPPPGTSKKKHSSEPLPSLWKQ